MLEGQSLIWEYRPSHCLKCYQIVPEATTTDSITTFASMVIRTNLGTVFENHSKCLISILAFSTNFCPFKSDLSGNTVWPQTSGFQKTRQNWPLWHFSSTFEHSKCRIWILNFGIFRHFCAIKNDLSGNTVWPQTSGFQKLGKMDYFWHFKWTFIHSKYKRSSLRSKCWMRLFLWFSNTMIYFFTELTLKTLKKVLSQQLFFSSALARNWCINE